MSDALAALNAWELDAPLRPLTGGLINETFLVGADHGPKAILQRLNTRIFKPCVHEDIEAVTAHLDAKGQPTPRLIRTRTGGLFTELDDGSCWRMQSVVGDQSLHKLQTPEQARSAGALVARFHAALSDLDWDFRMVRPGAHDTPAHFAKLQASLAEHRTHRLYDQVAPLADTIQSAWQAWQGPQALPSRVIHGDLKISNLRYAHGEAIALIDLDTLARGTLDVELGDALRSWCNRTAEDAPQPQLDLALLEAALTGYASQAQGVTPDEWQGILPGLIRITLELSARFAEDALSERYFGWDPSFGTRGDHNLIRAQNQAAYALAIREALPQAEAALRRANAGSSR